MAAEKTILLDEKSDEKPSKLDGSASMSLSPSEKTLAADGKGPESPQSTADAVPTSADEKDEALDKVVSVKDAQADLTTVITRGDGIAYPTGVKLHLVTLALCLSVFLMALDNTIIATAIPKITDHFDSLDDVGWYGSAYLLTTASFQLLFGKFYTFFSIKWIYLLAIGIFEVGSLISGVAPNSITLIIGRAVAGIGGAGIFSGALIIIAYSVPLVKRPIYTGLIGAMYGISSVAGPLLGGVFTDKVSWRWCFYINLPLGAVTIGAIALFFTSPERKAVAELTWKEKIEGFDLYGTLVFIPAIVCLLLALQWGGTEYPWNSGRIIALFVVFGILASCFVGIQFWKQDSATIPPSIMKNRSIAAAAWFVFTLGSFFMLLVYYLPIWFQAVKGASAVKSGIMSLPMLLTLVIVSIIAGVGVTVVGQYAPLMIASSVLTAVGTGLMYTFTPETSHSKWIGYQAITGIGIGLGMQQPVIAVQTVLDLDRIPIGTSVIVFLQTLGGALFISVGQNVFSNKLVEQLKELVPSLDPSIVLNTGATSIQTNINSTYLPGVTLAYNNALTESFLVGAAMAALTIFGALAIEWKSVKGKKIEVAAA